MIHISTSGNKLADPGIITTQGGHYQIFHISILPGRSENATATIEMAY
jgi:hypothetical protein